MCGKPVDPLRSRHVRVIGGKVASYCSEDCLKARPDATPIPVDVPRRRDSLDLKQAWEWLDDEPAEPAVHFDRRAAARRRSLRIVMMVVAAIAGYLAYNVL